MTGPRITLRDTETGDVLTHCTHGYGNYATLCGCSDDDEQFERVPTPKGQKIDCSDCCASFAHLRKYRATDFANGGIE